MRIILAVVFILSACAFGGADANMPPGGAPIDSSHTFVLHLPGIAGNRWVDKQMTSGLRDAGYSGELLTYDWTDNEPGISALRALKRNQAEAAKIADIITAHYHADPALRIIITSHSGGTGLAIWALEKLPADVKVDTVMLLSSALSPDYDLSKALAHLRGTCYSFYSENDVLVLNTGTKLFGTIDGKKCESAGEFGFIFPETADAKQYAKLIQKPYDKSWMQYDNIGDHMGSMRRPFSANVLAPLLFENSPRLTANAAADQKAGQRR
ncbi:MAG TPA: hypothetical protein VH370_08620 [Humisphaera sp.]|jgi:pimeloyl-ACP methyl ester carboxylesterase|nr:hypothetical protein [Humisphaera sp.]